MSDNTWGGSIDVTDKVSDKDSAPQEDVVVTESDLMSWSVSCLMRAGAGLSPATIMSNILLSADKRGHYSHGFNRLDIYYNDIAK